jgi:hypothetical protein
MDARSDADDETGLRRLHLVEGGRGWRAAIVRIERLFA